MFSDKAAAWKRIEVKFNASSSSTYRTADTLRSKWENLKKNAKKNYAQHEAELKKTGGGGYAGTLSAIDLRIIGILKTKATGMPAEVDDDAIPRDRSSSTCMHCSMLLLLT